MSESNDKLRAARERVESHDATGLPLSRAELAELANAWVWKQHKRVVELDANYIGKLERGQIRWPQEDYRAALRAVLGVEKDNELGFCRPRRSAPFAMRSNRQQLISPGFNADAAWTRFGALTGLLEAIQVTPVPSVVGVRDVQEIRAAASAFSGWDARYGGGLVREAVIAQLQHCVKLLNARCNERVRNMLFSAIGYLAHVTGFMAFDAYAHEDARRMFRFAQACAEHAGDWHLRAKVLSSMARQEIWCNDPDSGLTFTELALVRADRLTATERAMLHTARARALGKMCEVQQTMAAVGFADEAFADTDPRGDPHWMAYYDAAQHSGDTGHAMWELAVRGNFVSDARHRLEVAVRGHGEQFARARAISQTKLASLVMATGDPTEAVTLGIQALGWAGSLKSQRAVDDLREFSRISERHDHIAGVSDLRSQIRKTVALS